MADIASPSRHIKTDFRAGELDPELRMRVDAKVYLSGAQSLKNCIIHDTGAISRRPGTTKGEAFTKQVELIPFEFDADEKYILGFGDNYLIIYDETDIDTSVQIFTGSTDCPWDSTNFRDITITQSADVMFICHRSFLTKVLTRTSLTTFTMADWAFDAASDGSITFQPYLKFEAGSVTLTPSATTGSINVTASAAIFTSAWIGDVIRIYGSEILITAYTSTTILVGTVQGTELIRNLENNPFRYAESSGVIEVTDANHGLADGVSITIAGANNDYAIAIANINGARTITYIDDDHYEFTAASSDVADESGDGGGPRIKITTTAATRTWDEQAWSVRRGFPGACTFHENRLWFAGSTDVPSALWASWIGAFYSFDVGDGLDDESIQVSISSSKIASIRHLVSNRTLQIFTEGGEYAAVQSEGVTLTPSNITIRSQTPYGSATLRPKAFDGATLFVGVNGTTAREFIYDFGQDAFQSPDIGMLSSHLFITPVTFDVLYGSATRSEQYALYVNSDGTIATFHSIRTENMAAWTPWETVNGTFDSLVVVGSKVFVSVLRSGTYWLEQLEIDSDIYLDFSKTMTAAATDTWALGSDYANLTVTVVSDNYHLGTFLADGSGNIVLNDEVTDIIAGYDYGVEIIPMVPDAEAVDGPITGQIRRLNSVTVHTLNSLGLRIDAQRLGNLYVGDDFSVTPTLNSGKYKRYMLGYDDDPTVTIDQTDPFDFTILGLVMEVSY